MAAYVTEFSRSVAPLFNATLWLYDQNMDQFEKAVQLGPEVDPASVYPQLTPTKLCQFCALDQPNNIHSLNSCRLLENKASGPLNSSYCLPFFYGEAMVGVLSFNLPPDVALVDEQKEILNNVGVEMAIALNSAQYRNSLAELKIREAVLNERRNVSQDLHDNLGQNLYYIRFKLDQLTRGASLPDEASLRFELDRMLGIANKSSEMIRGIVAALHDDIPIHLGTHLFGHARSVASRAKFKIRFHEEGQQILVSPQVQRQIFYILSEALNNIEKHSEATAVEVELLWDKNGLTLKIADDGVGFDPSSIDASKHFGLMIMRERAEKLMARLYIESAPEAGTKVILCVPVSYLSASTATLNEGQTGQPNESVDRR